MPVIDLTGRPRSLAPNGGAYFEAVDGLRRALMSYSAIPAALDVAEHAPYRADLSRLRRMVVMANELYQAGRYSSAGKLLPGAMADAQLAARELRGDDRQAAQRIQRLAAEAAELGAELDRLVAAIAPWLLELPGVGPISAARSWSAGRMPAGCGRRPPLLPWPVPTPSRRPRGRSPGIG